MKCAALIICDGSKNESVKTYLDRPLCFVHATSIERGVRTLDEVLSGRSRGERGQRVER